MKNKIRLGILFLFLTLSLMGCEKGAPALEEGLKPKADKEYEQLFQAGNYEEVVEKLGKKDGLDQEELDILTRSFYQIGLEEIRKGDYKKASEYLEKSLENKFNIEAYSSLLKINSFNIFENKSAEFYHKFAYGQKAEEEVLAIAKAHLEAMDPGSCINILEKLETDNPLKEIYLARAYIKYRRTPWNEDLLAYLKGLDEESLPRRLQSFMDERNFYILDFLLEDLDGDGQEEVIALGAFSSKARLYVLDQDLKIKSEIIMTGGLEANLEVANFKGDSTRYIIENTATDSSANLPYVAVYKEGKLGEAELVYTMDKTLSIGPDQKLVFDMADGGPRLEKDLADFKSDLDQDSLGELNYSEYPYRLINLGDRHILEKNHEFLEDKKNRTLNFSLRERMLVKEDLSFEIEGLYLDDRSIYYEDRIPRFRAEEEDILKEVEKHARFLGRTREDIEKELGQAISEEKSLREGFSSYLDYEDYRIYFKDNRAQQIGLKHGKKFLDYRIPYTSWQLEDYFEKSEYTEDLINSEGLGYIGSVHALMGDYRLIFENYEKEVFGYYFYIEKEI